MKLLHISDIHYDLETLDRVADFAKKRDDLELIVCSGDLLGTCLGKEQTKSMMETLAFIQNHVKTDVEFDKLLSHLKFAPDVPIEIAKAAIEYSRIEAEFDKKSEEQYKNLLAIFKRFPQRVLCIPGNWDTKKYLDMFAEFDIHKKTQQVGNLKISGYGDSNSRVIFNPPTRVIGFSEDYLFGHFTKEDPDITVTHTPPRFMGDTISDEEGNVYPTGSYALLAYLRGESPILGLCGHIHTPFAGKDNRTIIVNSGNLGKYKNQNFGTFMEIDLDKKGVNSIIPHMVNGEEVLDGKELVQESA